MSDSLEKTRLRMETEAADAQATADFQASEREADQPDPLYVCDHAGECGMFCSGRTPRELGVMWTGALRCFDLIGADAYVRAIPAPEPAPRLLDGDDVVTEGTYGAWATFSVCRTYRYLLGRIWDPDGAILICGMLNPSKAGAFVTDPTATRVVGFAKRNKFGGTILWNAMGLIATDPRELTRHPDPVGPRNYDALRAAVAGPMLGQSVAAWGKPANKRIRSIVGNADANARALRPLWRFGEPTKDGWPRHPLYLRADTPIVKHEARR